jgi:hypothetical protein
MDLEEICVSMKNWVDSDLDRDYWGALVNAILNARIPQSVELISLVEVFTTI